MKAVLKFPWVLAASSVVIVVLSIVSYLSLGSGLLPEMDEGGFILDYDTPPGSSLAESDRPVFGDAGVHSDAFITRATVPG